MNTSDRPARGPVGALHQVPKNGGLRADLDRFLHGKPDRDRISVGTVANIQLMQECLSPAIESLDRAPSICGV